MADVLGDALQKLSVTRAPVPPANPPAMPALSPAQSVADTTTDAQPTTHIAVSETAIHTSRLPLLSEPTPVPELPALTITQTPPSEANSKRTAIDTPVVGSATASANLVANTAPEQATETESPAPASVELKTSSPRTSRWDSLMSVVSERRRQIAAVVVVICMAGFWFEESNSAKSDGSSADVFSEDFADVEAALSEFDVKSGTPLREPAEPVDTSTSPGFDLTIPGDNSFSATSSGSSNPSETTATYPDAFGNMEIPTTTSAQQAESAPPSQSSGFSAAPVSAPAGPGRSVKARLSHSIQPIH